MSRKNQVIANLSHRNDKCQKYEDTIVKQIYPTGIIVFQIFRDYFPDFSTRRLWFYSFLLSSFKRIIWWMVVEDFAETLQSVDSINFYISFEANSILDESGNSFSKSKHCLPKQLVHTPFGLWSCNLISWFRETRQRVKNLINFSKSEH